QDQDRPGGKGLAADPGGGEGAVAVVVVVDGQADLLEVVGALQACGGLADLLHRGEQQADEDRDDGDDHQQLGQGEARAGPRGDGESHGTPSCDSGTDEVEPFPPGRVQV